MGKSTAEELGVLKIMVNALSNDELFSAYPNVVNKKLGKLKDCEVKLHIDRTVPPVANKHYRIPFHLRDKVEEELQTSSYFIINTTSMHRSLPTTVALYYILCTI